MKYLIQRYSNTNKSDNLGFVRVGKDSFSLRRAKETVKGILNGSEIFLSDFQEESAEKVACLLAKVFSHLCEKNAANQLVLYKIHWRDSKKEYPSEQVLSSLTPRIASNIKVILRSHPREEGKRASEDEKVSSNIDPKILFHNLGVFSRKISNIAVSLNSAHHYSDIITKRQLVPTMWGAEKTQEYLDGYNRRVASLKKRINTAGMHNELIKRGSAKIKKCVKESSLDNQKKSALNKITIPDIIDSYSVFKKTATDAMLELSPLLYVDEVFQRNTRYPASWFISDEILNNMKEDFEHLASFVGDLPAIESKVVIPLEMVGSQISK